MNNLNQNFPKIEQPKKLKIKLKEHQKTSIYAMNELEQKGELKVNMNSCVNHGVIIQRSERDSNPRYFSTTYLDRLRENNFQDIEYTINTNIGVLSDKVGSGKTYSMIGLIEYSKTPPNNPKIITSTYFTSVKYTLKTPAIPSNLILIPHGLTVQWYNAFKMSSLKIKLIHRKTALNSIKSVDIIFNEDSDSDNNSMDKILPEECLAFYDVILVSSTMVSDFLNKYKQVIWSRIIIDEVLSIKLPSEIPWNANFIWFITATPSGLEYIKKMYIRYIFSNLQKPIYNNLIIKNCDEYITESMNLPDINQVILRSLTPKMFGIIKDYVSNDVLNMLNAGNIHDAISKINCNADTEENIFKAITKNLEKEIHNEKAQLAYKESIIPTDRKTHEESLEKLKTKILSLETKYNSIKEKIASYQNSSCPICLEDLTNPAVMNCCNNIFCLACLTSVKGKCPLCRKTFQLSDLNIIMDTKVEKSSRLLTKSENLINIIKKNKKGKFLIFSCYENTNDNISVILKDNNIIYSKLIGASSSIRNIIEKFDKGEIPVLLLNAQYYGSGLNLQMATDIIIYHEMNRELETQIIGRGQRIGRKDKLNVYYLLHDNENNNVKNPSLDISITDTEDENLMNFIITQNEIQEIEDEDILDSDEELLRKIQYERIQEQEKKKEKKPRKKRNTNIIL